MSARATRRASTRGATRRPARGEPQRDPRVLGPILRALRTAHGCHTAILYGSRARGEATEQSDYDVVGVRRAGPVVHWGDRLRGRWIDVFLYPEARLRRVEPAMLSMRDGVVLFEKGRTGTRLLERLARLDARGPARPDPVEVRTRAVWARKMLGRIAAGGVAGELRRLELLAQLLEDWFFVRRRWYRGPNPALATLAAEDAPAHALYRRALRRPRDRAVLEALVRRMTRRPARGERSVRSGRTSTAKGPRTRPTRPRGRRGPRR